MKKLIVALLAVGSASAATCDRGCLRQALDEYLLAVVAHNPSGAHLSPGYRETQNSVVKRAGAGIWQSATALGKLQRRYVDAESAQAGYFGTVDEAAGPAIVTVRLKVDNGKIIEAEWFAARKNDPGIGPNAGAQANAAFYDATYLLEHAPPERTVPKQERVSRADLIGITNSYFDGLSAHDGSLIVAHSGCVRLENGVLTTQRPGANGGPPTDCTDNGAMRNIYAVVDRRYPLVDEEAGVVLALGVFERSPGAAMRRNMFSEWFYIDQAKIRSVYSSMFYPEQNAIVPNWPPYAGNWQPAPPAQ
jgi:hypothetical protein